MGTENAIHTLEDLKEGAGKVVDRARNLSARVGQKLDTAYEDVVRGVRKIKTSAEDVVEGTRHKIKENPLAIVGGVALGAFAAGILTGYIIRARRQ